MGLGAELWWQLPGGAPPGSSQAMPAHPDSTAVNVEIADAMRSRARRLQLVQRLAHYRLTVSPVLISRTGAGYCPRQGRQAGLGLGRPEAG
ncbi:hypothetical protein [Mycobacterium montefiorense]|nr:hypothetical protein [Mycobacterium montefiorense]